MKNKPSKIWRLTIVSNGHTRHVKLLGGIGKDELVAFGVYLKEGDLLLVEKGGQKLGYADLYGGRGDFVEQEGYILVQEDGEYDIHLDTSVPNAELVSIYAPDEASKEAAKLQKRNLARMRFHKGKEGTLTVLHNVLIFALVFIWLIPIFWLILVSLTKDAAPDSLYSFFPEPGYWSFDNYIDVFTKTGYNNQFPRWFLNTLIVSVCSTIVSTLFVLMTAFAFSRFRFKKRKGLMNLSMVIALFPGMLTMFVSYELFQYVFKLEAPLIRLIIAYSAGAGLGYLVAKGFFDTIPLEIDEAARIDGASKARIFFQILVPLSKPIIVYTIITSFMSPWVDFVFANIIEGNGATVYDYTVAMGLIKMIDGDLIYSNFGMYIAGSVIVAIPLSVLFIIFQRYYVGGVTGGAVKG